MKLCLEWQDLEDRAKQGKASLAQARRVIAEITQRTTGEQLEFHTCRGWITEWAAGKFGAVSDRTLKKYRQITNEFLAHLGDRADRALEAIGPKDVRAFRDSLAAAGHSPFTVNQSIKKVLTGPFAAAARMGYIPTNPCAAVESLRDEAETEKDVFTPEQVRKLLAAAEGDWVGMILGGYFTGLRLRDLSDMRNDVVDLRAGGLRRKTSKTGKWVTVPLHPQLLAWLREHRTGGDHDPVFPTLSGKSGSGKSGLSSKFKRLMEKAKVAGRTLRKGKGQGRQTNSLSFHSLRHSFNSTMANAGVSQELRQKLTGHASATMNSRYTHLEVETMREAVSKIPESTQT
jgi:integrase